MFKVSNVPTYVYQSLFSVFKTGDEYLLTPPKKKKRRAHQNERFFIRDDDLSNATIRKLLEQLVSSDEESDGEDIPIYDISAYPACHTVDTAASTPLATCLDSDIHSSKASTPSGLVTTQNNSLQGDSSIVNSNQSEISLIGEDEATYYITADPSSTLLLLPKLFQWTIPTVTFTLQ
ncbi:hypothetical protein GE061_000083 [Apolygus lucorum]|uniref:Uncharacterized protein n=1 Tax=Apolygus lucorum TaxID=248454 RepID=A0A6A4KNQ1_APOLU|nr:hypothetical protein GE061_000083 [Apolygus lucorum]